MERPVHSRGCLASFALVLSVLASLASVGSEKADGKAASSGESRRGGAEIHLKGGEVVTGTLLDVDNERVVVTVGQGRRMIPRAEVTRVQRAASTKRIRFVEKKHARLLASGEATAADWRKLAGYCGKQHLIVERRRALREWLKHEPDATRIRLELGHARLAGAWLDEESVSRKLEAGYRLSAGELVKVTRVYYRNNELLKEPDEYLRDYMQVLERRHENVEEKKTTMGGLQAHKITYTQKKKD